MAVIKILGLSGSSRESWADAVERAVVEATRLLQPITDLHSSRPEANGAMTRLDEYTATVCVAFIVDEPESQKGNAEKGAETPKMGQV